MDKLQSSNSPLRILERSRWFAVIEVCVVFAGLFFLLALSAEVYAARYGTPLNPDTKDWLAAAQRMTWFYDTGRREPSHPLVLRLALGIFADPEQALRLATVAETTVAALCSYAMARILLGRMGALAVYLLLCSNPVVIHYSVSGMREPLQMALGAACVALFVAARAQHSIARTIGAGVVGAALVLTRTYGAALLITLGLLSIARVAGQWRVRESFRREIATGCLLFCIATLLVVPRRFAPGDNVVNVDLMYWRGIELFGRPGDIHSIGPIRLIEFVFAGGRSNLDVLELYMGNLVRYFVDYLPFYLRGYEWGSIFVAAGLFFSLRRGLFELPLGLFASLAPILPIMHLNQEPGVLGIESRFFLPAFPFALGLLIVTIEAIISTLYRGFVAPAPTAAVETLK